jgi:hypothetical protein
MLEISLSRNLDFIQPVLPSTVFTFTQPFSFWMTLTGWLYKA